MPFVAYNIETTKLVFNGKLGYHYGSEKTAKAGITRMLNKRLRTKGIAPDKQNYAVADTRSFFETVEKKELRIGVGPGAGVEHWVGVNTPWTSGPWSETYWCS